VSKRCTCRIQEFSFGSIQIDGVTYEHDVRFRPAGAEAKERLMLSLCAASWKRTSRNHCVSRRCSWRPPCPAWHKPALVRLRGRCARAHLLYRGSRSRDGEMARRCIALVRCRANVIWAEAGVGAVARSPYRSVLRSLGLASLRAGRSAPDTAWPAGADPNATCARSR